MDPVLVEVTRGNWVESRHRGAVVAVDAQGGVVFALGDVEQPVYPRSAVKAILALPLVESGAADRLNLTDAEIALACSSHSGEPVHVEAARSMLRRAGRDEAALECGTHWPASEQAARSLAASGGAAGPLHNNCSGKHAGFVCLACDRGDDPAGYVRPDHPTMRIVTQALAEMTEASLDEHNRAIDGCSIPTFAVPLRNLALAFAKFASGRAMAPSRAAAIQRIRGAVAAHPIMVAGTDRFDTNLAIELGPSVFTKAGAEGVFCAALPEQGIGIAVKCDDGAGRAAEAVTAASIARFLPGRAATLRRFSNRPLHNWNGLEVGWLRPSEAFT